MIAIDFALQLTVTLSVFGLEKPLPLAPLLLATAFVMALHAPLMYFSVWYAGKLFIKQQAQKLAKRNR